MARSSPLAHCLRLKSTCFEVSQRAVGLPVLVLALKPSNGDGGDANIRTPRHQRHYNGMLSHLQLDSYIQLHVDQRHVDAVACSKCVYDCFKCVYACSSGCMTHHVC